MDPSIVVGLCSLCTLIGLLLGIVLWHYFGPASGGGVQGRWKRGWQKPSASYPPQPRDMPVPRFRHDLGAPIEPACKRPHEHEARRCRMSRSEFESFLGPALSRNLCAEPDCPNVRAQASCYCEEHGAVRAATPPLCDLPRCTLNVVQGSTRCALHSDAEDPGVQVCTVGGRKHVLRDSPRMPPVVPPLRTDGESEPKTPRAISHADALVVARLLLAKHFAPDAWVTIERSTEPEHGPNFMHKHVHVWTRRDPEDAVACLSAFDEEWLALYPATMFLGFTVFPAYGAPPAHAERLIEQTPLRFAGHPNGGSVTT